jgi:hypothetical protein
MAPTGNSKAFLKAVDSGEIDPLFSNIVETEVLLTYEVLTDGIWQFAVCAYDKAGNFSDPYQSPKWKNVVIRTAATHSPSVGGLKKQNLIS